MQFESCDYNYGRGTYLLFNWAKNAQRMMDDSSSDESIFITQSSIRKCKPITGVDYNDDSCEETAVTKVNLLEGGLNNFKKFTINIIKL